MAKPLNNRVNSVLLCNVVYYRCLRGNVCKASTENTSIIAAFLIAFGGIFCIWWYIDDIFSTVLPPLANRILPATLTLHALIVELRRHTTNCSSA